MPNSTNADVFFYIGDVFFLKSKKLIQAVYVTVKTTKQAALCQNL